MDKKRILIVSARFYPRNSPRSFRTTELAKELVRQGHEVVVLIPFNGFDYSAFAKETHIEIKDLGAVRFKSIDDKGNKLELLVRRIIRRGLSLLFEYPEIELMFKVAKRLKQYSEYNLLISIAGPFPIHWGVARARTKVHRIADVWIADCGDPYMGDISDSFRKLFYFKYLEKWFCRKADYITVPFDGAKQAYYKEFHNKLRIIPQGFHFETIHIPEYKKVYDYPVFAYTGTFALGQCDPRPLLKFLSACNIKFKFIVYTTQPEILLSFKTTMLEKLEIREYIPFEQHVQFLSSMDFLITFEYPKTQRPSKLILYSISGRPVLNLNSNSDFSVLLEFMDGNYSNKMDLEPPDEYNIRVVAEKFIRLAIK